MLNTQIALKISLRSIKTYVYCITKPCKKKKLDQTVVVVQSYKVNCDFCKRNAEKNGKKDITLHAFTLLKNNDISN